MWYVSWSCVTFTWASNALQLCPTIATIATHGIWHHLSSGQGAKDNTRLALTTTSWLRNRLTSAVISYDISLYVVTIYFIYSPIRPMQNRCMIKQIIPCFQKLPTLVCEGAKKLVVPCVNDWDYRHWSHTLHMHSAQALVMSNSCSQLKYVQLTPHHSRSYLVQ